MTTPTYNANSVSRKYLPHRNLSKFYTPATKRLKLKTPRSKRINASRPSSANHVEYSDAVVKQSFKGAAYANDLSPEVLSFVDGMTGGFLGEALNVSLWNINNLLHRQWNVHSLSPLYNFKSSPEFFKQYARSLDLAFTQAIGSQIDLEDAEMKSFIDIYPGLNFHPDDHEAVKIQVTQKSHFDAKESVILKAILLCVDMDKSIFPPDLSSHFCYFPVIIVSGYKPKAEILLEWLEQHFDCRSSPLAFTDSDLRWLLAVGCSQIKCDKKMDVLLQYDVSKACSGLNMMNCSFEFAFCQELWNRLTDSSQTKDVMTEDEVNKFLSSLENHLEHTMHIYVTKLTLSEVGSPMAYVSSKGKFKMFLPQSVFHTLHLICDIARERYTQFYQS